MWTERGLAKKVGACNGSSMKCNTEDRRTQLQYEAGRSDPEFMARWWEMKYRTEQPARLCAGGNAPETYSGPQQYGVVKTPYGRIPVPRFPAPPASAGRQLSVEEEYGRYEPPLEAPLMQPSETWSLRRRRCYAGNSSMDAADRGGVSPEAITDQSMKPMSWREFFFGDGKSLGEALKNGHVRPPLHA